MDHKADRERSETPLVTGRIRIQEDNEASLKFTLNDHGAIATRCCQTKAAFMPDFLYLHEICCLEAYRRLSGI